jgi:hypothetical protein
MSCRSSTRVLARARNCWCRADPGRDDPFRIAADRRRAGAAECSGWESCVAFAPPPLAALRQEERDAGVFFACVLRPTLLGRLGSERKATAAAKRGRRGRVEWAHRSR